MSDRLPIAGSNHPSDSATTDLGALDPAAPVSVTLYLRRNPASSRDSDPDSEAQFPPLARHYLSDDDATDTFGATAADLEAVKQFAAEHSLEVLRVSQAARSIKLSGSAESVGNAFGVGLRRRRIDANEFRTHDGQATVPAGLNGIVEAVFGLDTRPLGRSFLRRAPDELQQQIHDGLVAGTQPANTYLPPEVAAMYGFPNTSASGQTVAIFAFNGPSTPGGYDSSVLDAYFTEQLKLAAPQITDVTVQGPGNAPGDGSNPNDASPEIYLDLSIVGSLATGAKIVVYFTEFTEQGWVDALTRASTDATNKPTVISISYGNPESGAGTAWSAAAVKQVNQAFEAAAARGKTITAAAGDSGAGDGESSGVHVDFPASSPWVLACGGTRLESSGGQITSEVVWNDQADGNGATGGGVSTLFPLPSWQQHAAVPPMLGTSKTGRGVPDVSSLADPETPFVVAQPGGPAGVGGTSAAAPLWAALIARCNAGIGAPVGYLNPRLYSLPADTLRDITKGNNAAPGGQGYDAGPGWDACTGWGSPGAATLYDALR